MPVGSVPTLTLGSHGDTMVPVPSACTVDGKPLASLLAADEIDALVDRTRNGGAEIVGLLKTGSAYYAPSAAAARMARAVAEDSGRVLPVCAWVDGEYGISGVYLGVEAEIGRPGSARGGAGPHRDRAGRAARGGRGGPRQAGRRRQPLTRAPSHPAPASNATPTSPTCSTSSFVACEGQGGRAWPGGSGRWARPGRTRGPGQAAQGQLGESAAPSGSTASSNTASRRVVERRGAGSEPGGQAPSITNAPGTSSSTYEKSSAPGSGSGLGDRPVRPEQVRYRLSARTRPRPRR